MADIKQRAKFDFIRYASCWEDTWILLDALRIQKGDKCLSIGSAGDNSLAMLIKDPSLVVAVDFNSTQHACIELRIQAFKKLSYSGLLEFLGIDPSNDRVRIYQELREGLSDYARSFFDENLNLIEKGIIHQGKFEKFFYIFRTYVVPFIHHRRKVRALLSKKSIAEQREFYSSVWNNPMWKIIFRVFFSKFMVGRMGRDPEFFKYVDADVSGSFKKRIDFHLTEVSTHDSPYLNCIFTGNYPRHALPLYLREENFELIRSRIDRVELFHGDINSCIDHYKDIKFDAFNMSDIFEYMSAKEHHDELAYLLKGASKGARFAFWNLLVDRFFPQDLPFEYEAALSEELSKQDRAPFYKRFVVGKVI